MAALSSHPGSLEAGEPRPDDEHVARPRHDREIPERVLLTRSGILHARNRELAIAARDAEVVADAHADPIALPVARPGRDERVGDQRARHPDQVAGALGERALADLGPVDPPFRDDSESGCGALRAGREGHAVSGLELHGWDDQEGFLVVAMTDADVVDLAVVREVRDRLLVALHRRGDGDPEQAIGADLGPQRQQDLACQARASLEWAAVVIRAGIALRRKELVDERVVGEHALDTVDAGSKRSARCCDMALDERGDILVVHRSQTIWPARRQAPAWRPAFGASRERIGVRSQVIELRDEHRAVLAHGVDDATQGGHEALVVVAVVLRRHRTVGQHRQRLHHDQAGATRSPRSVVLPRALTRNVILPERDRVRGEDDAARQAPPAKFQGREQEREGRVHDVRAPFSGGGPPIIRSRRFSLIARAICHPRPREAVRLIPPA